MECRAWYVSAIAKNLVTLYTRMYNTLSQSNVYYNESHITQWNSNYTKCNALTPVSTKSNGNMTLYCTFQKVL